VDEDLKKMIAEIMALLERAPSTEHARLQRELDGWAEARSFSQKVAELSDGSRPDVLRWRAATKDVFIGDAKVSANEGPTTRATLTRLDNYMEQFLRLLRSGTVTGGIFAIATDDADTATEWVETLNVLARFNGLLGPGALQGPQSAWPVRSSPPPVRAGRGAARPHRAGGN